MFVFLFEGWFNGFEWGWGDCVFGMWFAQLGPSKNFSFFHVCYLAFRGSVARCNM